MRSDGGDLRAEGAGWAVQKGSVYNRRGQPVRYWLCGASGPVIFLCNGLAGGVAPWAPVVRHFAGSCRVLLWDYPGQGASRDAVPDGGVGVESLAREALRLLRGVGIGRAVLAGQGTGVQVMLELFRSCPDTASCLVGVCGTRSGPLSSFLPFPLDRMAARAVGSLVLPPLAVPAWKVLRAFRAAAPLPASGGAARDPGEFRDDGPGGWLDALARMEPGAGLGLLASALFHHPPPDPRRHGVPLLILAGDRDGLVSPERARRMARSVPGCRLQVLPGCSHRALTEDPAAVCAHMETFLRESRILR